MAAASPNDIPHKRPFYLLMALSAAWIFGVSGVFEGCGTIEYYRDDAVDAAAYVPAYLEEDAERETMTNLTERLLQVRNAAQNRLFPLGVAELLLSGAMVIFAARAMGGRGSIRPWLIQVVCAHAVFSIVYYYLTPDVRVAAWDLDRAVHDIFLRHNFPDAAPFYDSAMAQAHVGDRAIMIFGLSLRMLANAFIVWALMRKRSIAFFDTTGGPLSEA